MHDFGVIVFLCAGPLIALVFFGAALMAAAANRRRREEIQGLQQHMDWLRDQQLRLAQQVARLEGGPPRVTTTVPPVAPDVSRSPPELDPVAAIPATQADAGVQVSPVAASAPSSGDAPAAQDALAPPAEPAVPAPPRDAGLPVSSPPPAAPPERKGPGLEEWLGVRGIALVGALTLVVAGVYFFRYSVEQGLITPTMRVILGVMVGLACIAASERSLRSRHALLANFVAGAGVAILYLASWSSGALYELVPRPAAFALMAVTTAACCALALRHKALSIAMIGLLGGFITPISLSTGQDRPLALFGYLLLLDVALLAVAQRMRWGLMALLSVLGTFVYQVGWVMGRMGGERVWLGVAVVAMFALVFALAPLLFGRKASAENGEPSPFEEWVTKVTQALAVLLPFLFPVFFATQEDLRIDLLPTLVLVTALTVGAGVISLLSRAYWLQVAAAAAGGVTLLLHVLADTREPLGWLFAFVALVVAAAHHVMVERWSWSQRPGTGPETDVGLPQSADSTEDSGFRPSHAFALFVMAALFAVLSGAGRMMPAAGTLTLLLIVVSATRVAFISAPHVGWALVAPLATLAMAGMHVAQGQRAGGPSELVWLSLCLVPVVASQGGVLRTAPETRRWLDHGAGLSSLVFAAHLIFLPHGVPATPWLYAFAAVGALLLLALPLARSGVGIYYGPVLLVLAAHAMSVGSRGPQFAGSSTWLACLVAIAASATVLPMLLLGERARRSRGLYRGAALATPFFFAPILDAYRGVFGHTTDGIPAVLAAVIVVVSLVSAIKLAPAATRISAIAWLAAAALGFITVAIPLQLENEWVTVGWALMGAALLALFRRVDHAGLKYFALLHYAAVGVRLLLNPYILDYHPVSAWPFLNWLAYTYLVPVAAAIAGFVWLGDIEIPRRRPFEVQVMPKQVALVANAIGLLAVSLGFAWVNLAIIDAFAPEGPLELGFNRQPARDLSLSLAWALYAALLLGIGMWRKNTALRVLSLGLLMLTIGKVFLMDLGNLEDLFRVASLVGLAISLMVTSLAYRRFVFPPSTSDDQEGGHS